MSNLIKVEAIRTNRLTLTPLSYEQMVNYVFGRKGSIQTDDDELWAVKYILNPMALADEHEHIFYSFWVAEDDYGNWIGDIGTKTPPNEYGVVEIGYYVAESERSKSYATEMVNGLLYWLEGVNIVNVVWAAVEHWNKSSMKVLYNNGFVIINNNENYLTFIKQLKF